MANNRLRRIGKELADITQDTHSNITAAAVKDDDLSHLKGSFTGPSETPYEGGTYVIDITIPTDYPFRPPVMKFQTKIWHPNVSSQTVRLTLSTLPYFKFSDLEKGAICLDTLGTAWSPVLTIKSALISLQSLLSTPEPKDPQDAEVAGMLLRNKKEFDEVARDWAVRYAGAARKDRGEGSGGATNESLKQAERQSKEDEEKEQLRV